MKAESIEIIAYVSHASASLPFIFYLMKYKFLPRENRIIGLLVIASIVFDTTGFFLYRSGVENAILINAYYLVAFLILCFFYYDVVFRFKCRTYLWVGIGVYALSAIIIGFSIGVSAHHGTLWAVTGLILVIFGIIYNNYQVEKPPLLDRNLYSGLIFNAAIMLYFSFNFFLFIIANYVLTELSPETGRMAWAFHNVNNIIKNIAFAFGFYYTNRRRLDLTDEEVERIQWRHIQ